MKHPFTAAVLAAGLMAAAGAANAADVEIKDAVARVVVVPEDRTDVAVEVVQGSSGLPAIKVSRTGSGKLIIDGDLGRNRIRGCNGRGAAASPGAGPLDSMGDVTVRVRDRGEIRMSAAPIITIRTPRDVDVKAGGAVFGWIGRANSVDLSNAGCGDWTVGDVRGALDLAQAGSGDTRAGSSASLEVSIAGSGDVVAGRTGALEVKIAGSGDVQVAAINGKADVSIAGSGGVTVRGGRATVVEASIAGSGDVRIDAPADSLSASIMGSGDVRVQSVSGQVSRKVMGSGNIRIGE